MKRIRRTLGIILMTLLCCIFACANVVKAASNEESKLKDDGIRLRIANSPRIISDNLEIGKIGEEYNTTIRTNNDIEGNTINFSIESGLLPSGLHLESDGNIQGIPTEEGEFKFSVRMANSFEYYNDDVKEFSINILESNAIFYSEKFKEKVEKKENVYIKTTSLLNAVKYVIYNETIETYAADSMVSFGFLNGKLPDGMYFRSNGEVYGIPKESGKFSFTVQIEGTNIKKKIHLSVLESTESHVKSKIDKGYEIIENRTTLPKEVNINNLTEQDYVITSKGNFSEFRDLYFNGVLLNKGEDYIVEEGSTEATIKRHIIKANSVEENNLAFAFTNKKGETKTTSYFFKAIPNKASAQKKVKDNKKDNRKVDASKMTKKIVNKAQLSSKKNTITKDSTCHIIQKGDTLWDLSVVKYGTGLEWIKIKDANVDIVPRRLRIGRKIIIP